MLRLNCNAKVPRERVVEFIRALPEDLFLSEAETEFETQYVTSQMLGDPLALNNQRVCRAVLVFERDPAINQPKEPEMARKETREVWISIDGAEFDNEADALEQDAVAELVCGLMAAGVGRDASDATLDGIARWVVRNYALMRKGV